jgi:hypothetical protein
MATDTKKAAAILRPFVVGSREIDTTTYDETRSLKASETPLPSYYLDPIGYAGCLYIEAIATADNAGGAATAFNPDAPFNVFSRINFMDINSKSIGGPMTGYEWYEIIKHGGYTFSDDARSHVTYSVTTGAGATGGSFKFVLRLPIEIIHRNALGALTNKNSGALLTLELKLAGSADVYSTAPSGAVSVETIISIFGWMDATGADSRGNPVRQEPPALDTTQFWTPQSYVVNPGTQRVRLQGIDGPIRNLLFVFRNSAGLRTTGDTNWPTLTTLLYENVQPMNRRKTIWQQLIGEWYGYTAATPDTAGARSYGLYPLPYTRDFSLKAGGESGFTYLPVTTNTNVTLSGTFGGAAANTLSVYVNKVYPKGGNPLALTGGR